MTTGTGRSTRHRGALVWARSTLEPLAWPLELVLDATRVESRQGGRDHSSKCSDARALQLQGSVTVLKSGLIDS